MGIVHLAPKSNPDIAYCGTPRGDKPFKPWAPVTCVVCLDLKGKLLEVLDLEEAK